MVQLQTLGRCNDERWKAKQKGIGFRLIDGLLKLVVIDDLQLILEECNGLRLVGDQEVNEAIDLLCAKMALAQDLPMES